MHRCTNGFGAASNRRQRHGKAAAVQENGLDLTRFLRDPSPDHHDQPESAGSLRRQIGQMLMKHHQSIERNNHALQPVSPASYGSSLEVATYNKALTPSSSMEFRGHNLKTSTELLKVLNRIWSLEEQHAANLSLIKALKTELSHSRARIKELLRYQEADRHELDGVVKQLAEDKLSRKSKEAMRKELEDERKLRKRAESLQRKLGRELLEVKSSLSSCVEAVKRGDRSKKTMEMLCDEFAKGIKSYDEEIRCLKQRVPDKDWAGPGRGEGDDQMVLHIAESWLDERTQMRLEGNNSSVLDKLEAEIETFLKAKQRNRRSSLESVPFNDLSAPPRDVECEEEEEDSSNCFELKKPDETDKPNQPNNKAEEDGEPEKSSNNKTEEETDKCASKNDVMEEMIRRHGRLLSETREMEEEASCSYPSSRRQASPVRQWSSRNIAPHLLDSSEMSVKALGIAMGNGVIKDKTLKSKVAKSSRSRLRLFKG